MRRPSLRCGSRRQRCCRTLSRSRRAPQPELYNLFVNGATASLCSCLKLCQRHAAFLELTEQAAHPSALDAHRHASHRWSMQCDRLFDLTVDLLADFEERVYEKLLLP
ncbi:hypothetical protein MRX96_043220 [Rhipicephalus microplus]